MNLRGRQRVQRGHRGSSGLMPASFRVNAAGDGIDANFGDRAIGENWAEAAGKPGLT